MEKTKKQHPEPILTLKLAVLLGVAVAFCLPAIVLAEAPFGDSFEAYPLGDLDGNNNWLEEGAKKWQVNWDITPPDGLKSVYCNAEGVGQGCRAYRTGDLIENGSWTFDFIYPSEYNYSWERLWIFTLGDTYVWAVKMNYNGAVCKIWKGVFSDLVEFSDFTCDVWHNVSVEWRAPAEIRFKLDTNDWTEWESTYMPFSGVNKIFLDSASYYEKHYVDNLGVGALPELRVWGVSPESGTTSTSTATNFTIGWEGFDFEDIYEDFVFSFYEENTEIIIGSVIYTPTTTAGTYILPFSDFGFDKNGKYYLKAKARSPLYEWTAYYTSDLVSPEWWINFNVSGWEAVFEMPEFESWYASTSKFATATAIFTGITTFLSPIMNKLGEFGNKVVEFLDLDEAYDRGYDLGKIIPTFRHYVSGIEVFFGGFPIIQIFLAFMVILLGIFIVRLIRG